MGAETLAVETTSLSRRYGRRWALADVSLRVLRGSVVMVTGRNGSGKTTLLRVLATAIRADLGGARVAGYDIRTQKEEVRRQVSLLGHDLYLYDSLSGLENLEVAARFLGRSGSEVLMNLLAQVGLLARAGDPVASYSAGMRKRLALARTLLQEASVILLDEPYNGLDPDGFRLIDDLLCRFRERGATVLMATHLLERGSALCDQGIVLEEGRLTWSGPAADLPKSAEMSGHARGQL